MDHNTLTEQEEALREGLARVPSYMHNRLIDYVMRGVPTGGFLYALLIDSLTKAFGLADEFNRASMFEWAVVLHNHLPTPCWGSPEKVARWTRKGGMAGRAETATQLTEPEKQ